MSAPGRPCGRSVGSVEPVHQIDHGFGDVGRVIADPLDVLRAEQEMGAEGDVARILHHMRQEIAEHRVFQRVEIGVPLPDVARPLDVALRVGVEHVLHQFGREIVHVLDADDGAGQSRFDADLDRALGDVLGQIPDPLEIARDPNGADDLAQVVRHRLPARDRQRRLLLDLALQARRAADRSPPPDGRARNRRCSARRPRRSPSSRPGRPSRRSAARAGRDPCRRL